MRSLKNSLKQLHIYNVCACVCVCQRDVLFRDVYMYVWCARVLTYIEIKKSNSFSRVELRVYEV